MDVTFFLSCRILLYFGQISTGLVITLKASLMWVPILGPVSFARASNLILAEPLLIPLTKIPGYAILRIHLYLKITTLSNFPSGKNRRGENSSRKTFRTFSLSGGDFG